MKILAIKFNPDAGRYDDDVVMKEFTSVAAMNTPGGKLNITEECATVLEGWFAQAAPGSVIENAGGYDLIMAVPDDFTLTRQSISVKTVKKYEVVPFTSKEGLRPLKKPILPEDDSELEED